MIHSEELSEMEVRGGNPMKSGKWKLKGEPTFKKLRKVPDMHRRGT
jgi:hypothetical protein